MRNALRILTLLKRQDIPVAGGALKPLLRELIIADNVHGESGLDGPSLPDPDFAPQADNAVELMARILRTSPHPVTIVATGPLTNVALLLAGHGALAAKIERIVIMGGAVMLGNWTAAAEFNIFVDPEAADRVFKSGIPITMAGLDVTHQAQVMDEDIDRIRQLNNPVADVVAGLLISSCCITARSAGVFKVPHYMILAPLPGYWPPSYSPALNAGLASKPEVNTPKA